MTKILPYARALVFGGAVLFSAMSASATTLNFDGAGAQGGGIYQEDGLEFDDVRIVNGNCGTDKPCAGLNDNESSTLTKIGGGTFTLTSFWFELLGQGTGGRNPVLNTLYVLTDLMVNPLALSVSVFDHNDGGQTYDLSGLPEFQNTTFVRFYTAEGGNVRIDDLVIATAAVPLPAAGWMLFAGVGALAALRRRKQV